MSAESLRMVMTLTVDESLYTNYDSFQSKPITECISFPSHIRMFPWNDVNQLTEYIFKETRILCIHQRLFFRGREITAYKHGTAPSLSYYGVTHGSNIYLQCCFASVSRPIVAYGNSVKIVKKRESSLDLLISCSMEGLKAGILPELSGDGEGGTYFLSNGTKDRVSCFKPCDEEAGASNNPRGRICIDSAPHQGLNCGISPSSGHLREIAAYLFDSQNGHFHSVPGTIRVEIAYNCGFNYNSSDSDSFLSKIGSLQSYIEGEVIENFGIKNFSIREVHKIGILDILLLNSDRNSGNVLVSKSDDGRRYSLIPIDHGLSLPKYIEITLDSWVWINWSQSKEPFDPHTMDYINNICIDDSIKLLRERLNFDELVFSNMRISHLVLQKGAMRGLTLNEIGSIIARPNFDTKSILEELMVQAESLSLEKIRQNKHLINRIRLKRHSNSKYKAMKIASIDDEKENKYSIIWTPNYVASSSKIEMNSSSKTPQRLKLKSNGIPSLSLNEKADENDVDDCELNGTKSLSRKQSHISAKTGQNRTIFKSMCLDKSKSEIETESESESEKGATNAFCFSALNIESLIVNCHNESDAFLYDDLVPLSRSTSCIDTKTSVLNSSSGGKNSFDFASASLINHRTMLDKRRELNGYCCIREETESPSTTSASVSHQSQDDIININHTRKRMRKHGIHPIMARMQKETHEVNKYFMYYLDQLLGIQCERISNRSRKCDDTDNIYDIDTVQGSFIWKNELRKHWIRSRLERKKLMAPAPPTNPFHEKNKEKETHMTHLHHNDIQQEEHTDTDDDDDDDGHDWFGAERTVDYDDYDDITDDSDDDD